MNFRIATKNYAVDNLLDFKGRASRWEYWGGSLGFSFILFLVGIISGIISEITYSFTAFSSLIIIFYFWAIIANLSSSIRRLHDVGKSGWNLLWTLTGFGAFYILFLDVQPSVQKDNEWGPPPPHTVEI